MVCSKTMITQVAVLVTVILCIQTAMGGPLTKPPPPGCNCYTSGNFNSPRRPCFAAGCSAGSTVNCNSDTSLFLSYANPKDADPPSNLKPSLTANRFGACSCPAENFLYYGSSGKSHRNAYYVTSGLPSSKPDTSYFNATASCAAISNYLTSQYGASNSIADNAGACCTYCCSSGGD